MHRYSSILFERFYPIFTYLKNNGIPYIDFHSVVQKIFKISIKPRGNIGFSHIFDNRAGFEILPISNHGRTFLVVTLGYQDISSFLPFPN